MQRKSVCNFCYFSLEDSEMYLLEVEEEMERDPAIPSFVH